MESRTIWRLVLGATLALTSGCATSALWEEDRFAQFREPASLPNLRAFQSHAGDDVLVCYDEVREDDSGLRSRAYWLAADHEPVKNPYKPRFISVKKSAGLASIPVLEFTATNAPLAGLHVITSSDAHEFQLRSDECDLVEYELPVYQETSGRVKQVLLTPFAFAADLTIVGGCLFLVAWSEGGCSDIH